MRDDIVLPTTYSPRHPASAALDVRLPPPSTTLRTDRKRAPDSGAPDQDLLQARFALTSEPRARNPLNLVDAVWRNAFQCWFSSRNMANNNISPPNTRMPSHKTMPATSSKVSE